MFELADVRDGRVQGSVGAWVHRCRVPRWPWDHANRPLDHANRPVDHANRPLDQAILTMDQAILTMDQAILTKDGVYGPRTGFMDQGRGLWTRDVVIGPGTWLLGHRRR